MTACMPLAAALRKVGPVLRSNTAQLSMIDSYDRILRAGSYLSMDGLGDTNRDTIVSYLEEVCASHCSGNGWRKFRVGRSAAEGEPTEFATTASGRLRLRQPARCTARSPSRRKRTAAMPGASPGASTAAPARWPRRGTSAANTAALTAPRSAGSRTPAAHSQSETATATGRAGATPWPRQDATRSRNAGSPIAGSRSRAARNRRRPAGRDASRRKTKW